MPHPKRFSLTVRQYTCHIHSCTLMPAKSELYSDGKYWCGRGIGVDSFTQGKTLDELKENIREAVDLHVEEELAKGESIQILSLSGTDRGTVAPVAGCWQYTGKKRNYRRFPPSRVTMRSVVPQTAIRSVARSPRYSRRRARAAGPRENWRMNS